MKRRSKSYHRIEPEFARLLLDGTRLNSAFNYFSRAHRARCTRHYGYRRLA